MENLQNQQCVVRTDFTLKYYELDELIEKNQLAKIVGSGAKTFVRSWLDYTLVRGDRIIPWLTGDFSVLLKTASHIFKEHIEDEKALAEHIKTGDWNHRLTFAVNIDEVQSNQLSYLLEALNNSSHSHKEVDLPESEGDEEPGKIEKSMALSAKKYLANVVLWQSDNKPLKNYDTLLNHFNATLDIGDAKVKDKKTEAKPKNKLAIIGVCAVVVLGFVFWQTTDKSGFDNEQSAELLAQDADKLDDVKAASKDAKIIASEKSDSAQSLQTSSAEESVNTTVDSEAEPQELIDLNLAAKNTLVKKNAKEDQQSRDENSSAPTATSKTADTKTEQTAKKESLENIAISNVSNGSVVNVGSSIKTSSSASISENGAKINAAVNGTDIQDAQAAKLIDGLLAAWQAKDTLAYSQFYSDDYSGSKKTHKQWLALRTKRIEKPKWLELARSNLKHLKSENVDEYVLTYTLSYVSPYYKDKTFKKMTLKNMANGLKIVKEENLKVTKIK